MSKISVSQLSGITANNNVVTMPSGHVFTQPGQLLQVQQFVHTTTMTSNSTNTWFDLGMSVSITPKFATSKILVTVQIGRATGSNSTLFRTLRNGSTFSLPAAEGSRVLSHFSFSNQGTDTNHADGGFGMTILDSPNTVSPLTYSVQAYNEGGGNHGTLFALNRNYGNADNTVAYNGRTVSTITVMEIAQ